MSYKLSKRSRDRLEGIHVVLIDIIEAAITDSPFDFGIPQMGGLRTAEDQAMLYSKGVSQCDGYVKKSYHQTGRAFDIYAYVDGKASWNVDHLSAIADHIMCVAKDKFNVELEWGGHWKNFVDLPHFQI